jgi:nicotinamidase-related amidase
LYGVATELCVQFAAFGLLQTGARVELVTDAVEGLSDEQEEEMAQKFAAQGGVLTTTAQVIAA